MFGILMDRLIEGELILLLGGAVLRCELLFVKIWTMIALLVELLVGWSEDSAQPMVMIAGRAVSKKLLFLPRGTGSRLWLRYLGSHLLKGIESLSTFIEGFSDLRSK